MKTLLISLAFLGIMSINAEAYSLDNSLLAISENFNEENPVPAIVIEEEDEKGIIEILGTDQEMIDTVIQKIDDITFKPEYGKEYDVKVVKILEFGAVVEFRPGKEVLLHVSEIAWERVEKVEKYLNLGDITRVKYMGIDSRTKKQKVSRKILLERPKKKE